MLRISKEMAEDEEQFDERQRETCCAADAPIRRRGEGDDTAAEIEELKKAIDDAGMPEDIYRHAAKELKRLQRMGEGSAEGSMLRTYLEWLSELPWKNEEGKPIDIAEARRVLDEDHFGLDKIKRRILEHLAVRKLNPAGKSPILCFVGPPGLARLRPTVDSTRHRRKFQRIALAGARRAAIRGHRHVFGALPCNVIQALRRAESKNAC